MRKLIALLGLAVLGVGGYYVVHKYAKSVPETLRANAGEALARANIPGLTVEMDGLDATLVGAVPSQAQREAAVAAVQRVSGIRNVDAAEVVLGAPDRGPGEPPPAPREGAIDLDARWRDGALTLTGYVRGAALGERVAQKIAQAFPGAPVDGTLARRDGEPADGDETVKRAVAGLEALAQTNDGALRVTDLAVTLNGSVPDEATRERMAALLRNHVQAPVELALVVSVVAPVVDVDLGELDPLDEGELDADADVVTDGDVELAAVEGDVEAADDAQEPIADAEAAVEADAEAAVEAAVEADTEAAASDEDAPAAVGDEGPPGGVDLAATTPLSAEQCEEVLWWLVEGEKRIQFDGRRRILPESDPTLVRVAAVLKRCADAAVVVEGYTDAYGEPDEQRKMSWRWAFNVTKRLEELGIEADRLTVRAYGVNRPRYSNGRETRHLNRRIEFKLTGVK